MINHLWGPPQQTMLVCVDSYDKGIPAGEVYLPGHVGEHFDSLSQFLLRAEALLDSNGAPQSFTTPRMFAVAKALADAPINMNRQSRGGLATFEMQVLFRQHASWQGQLQWLERNTRQSFRSVLELITLMDSALREEGT